MTDSDHVRGTLAVRSLFEVISDMENTVRSADERAVAVLKLVRAAIKDGGLSDAEWRALERVADDVTTATLNIVAEWETCFKLAQDLPKTGEPGNLSIVH